MPDIQPANQTPVNQRESIGILFAQGYSQKEIAKQVGISQPTISRRLSSDKTCQAIVEQIRKQNAQLLPQAFKKHAELIHSDTEKIAMDAINLTYKTTGILPTRTGDQYFIQNNQTNVFSPDIMRLLDIDKAQEGVIDIDSDE